MCESEHDGIADTLQGVHAATEQCLDILWSLIDQFDPAKPGNRPNGLNEQEWKDFSWLWAEYVDLDESDSYRREFAASQTQPVEFCGLIAPSAHALLRTILKRVLYRVWDAVRPGSTRNPTMRGVSLDSPADFPTFDEDEWTRADRSKVADAVRLAPPKGRPGDILTCAFMERLGVLLEQEYGRAVNRAKPEPVADNDRTGDKPPQKQKANVNARMTDLISKNPATHIWSAAQFATKLNCSKSAIAETPAWKHLRVAREAARQEKAADTQRRRQGSRSTGR